MRKPLSKAVQIIADYRERLMQATTAPRIEFAYVTAIGAIDTLENLRLISMDDWQAFQIEFYTLATLRLDWLEGGAK